MKRLLILFSILFLAILLGCSDNNSEEVMGLNDMVNEEMGVEILIPEYQYSDVYIAYVLFLDNGEPREVNIQYSKNKGSLNEEYAKQMEEQLKVKLLYGPFNVDYNDVSVSFSFSKNDYVLDNIDGERIRVGGVEFIIQDKVDSNNFQHHHFVIDNYRYGISYQLDHFSEEEALEQTKVFIEDLNKRIKESKTGSKITDNRPKLLVIKDEEGNELASNIDMTIGSAKISESANGIITFKLRGVRDTKTLSENWVN